MKLIRFSVSFKGLQCFTYAWTNSEMDLHCLCDYSNKMYIGVLTLIMQQYYFQENPALFLDSLDLQVALGQSRPPPVRRLCCLRRQEVQRRRQLREEDGIEGKDIICQKSSWKRRDDFEMICNIIT